MVDIIPGRNIDGETDKTIRILLYGLPGTSIHALSQKIGEMHNLDVFTVLKDPEEKGYVEDKIEDKRLDTGDMSSGSESQQMARDLRASEKDRKMDSVSVTEVDDLTEEELNEIYAETQGICATEVGDARLVEWATHVILLDAETDMAVQWFSGRRKCFTCGSIYHLEDKPSKVAGICDRCGTDLRKKTTDNKEVVEAVYAEWHRLFLDIKDMSKKKNFLKIRVDRARDFEHIFLAADRWLRNQIGQKISDWKYK
jgi:adenylate kinase family enzyme